MGRHRLTAQCCSYIVVPDYLPHQRLPAIRPTLWTIKTILNCFLTVPVQSRPVLKTRDYYCWSLFHIFSSTLSWMLLPLWRTLDYFYVFCRSLSANRGCTCVLLILIFVPILRLTDRHSYCHFIKSLWLPLHLWLPKFLGSAVKRVGTGDWYCPCHRFLAAQDCN